MQEGLNFFIYPYIFPFRQHEVVRRLWWLPLVAAIPLLNVLILSGWRMEIVRRVGQYDSTELPESSDFMIFIRNGGVLFLASLAYFIIPFFIITLITGSAFGFVWQFFGLIIQSVINPEPIFMITTEHIVDWLSEHRFHAIWFAFALPCFRMALLRSARQDDWQPFLQIHKNMVLVMQHIGYYVGILVFTIFMIGLLWLICKLILVVNVFTWLAGIICLLVYYSTTGYLYGKLGREIYE